MSDFALFGRNLFGDPVLPPSRGIVSDRFIVPPFTVMDARAGEWQDRKQAWFSLGLQGEVGRTCEGSNAWNDLSTNPRAAESTRKIAAAGDGPTIFDPVLCELVYEWFCPQGGSVVDPFAGGSVRGIVAGCLGRRYWGCDLRAEQVTANQQQADELQPLVRPEWVCDDSASALTNAPDADFVFSCPPYGDLERYSNDVRDLSTMDWPTFEAAYQRMIGQCVCLMKLDSFACFVVGDFRDKAGFYRNFTGVTVAAFEAAGAKFYNDAVLVTMIGSASMRSKQFKIGRKMIKTHQNVLVFCKGDWRKAAAKCNESVTAV